MIISKKDIDIWNKEIKCNTCEDTKIVIDGYFGEEKEEDCPDCINFELADMSGASKGDR